MTVQMQPLRLRDRFGRTARDLRISLTDRCNLRCTYCMPAEGLAWLPTEETLSDAEVMRLVRIGVEDLGIREVRFTGGEPLLRPGLVDLVEYTKSLRTDQSLAPEVALTTNALGLDKKARKLAAAGLDRVNVSLDTPDRERYAALTRRDRFDDAIRGIRAARDAGLGPVKVNAVIMRGVNDMDIEALLLLALREGYHLRYIEQMPLGPTGSWHRDSLVSAEEILTRLQARFTLHESGTPRDGAPAELWTVEEGIDHPAGDVGIIASVTRPFCGDCDRTRLTADGQLRTCLFSTREDDLRGPLRDGASDAEVASLWARATIDKPAGHRITEADFHQPDRQMSKIGG